MSKIVQNIAVLSQASSPASPCEAEMLIEELKEELKHHEHGIGLSAIQIGIPKCVSIVKRRNGEYIHLINPTVVEDEDEFLFAGEGCLSFPGRYCTTTRYRQILIENQVIQADMTFRTEKLCFYYDAEAKTKDVECIAVQHEIQHLRGKTMFNSEFKSKPVVVSEKIGRNDPCPCGSGKKWKKCCGA